MGKFKPLLAGTFLARICTVALPGKYTAAEIAKAAGLREDQVAHRLRHGLGAAHGIGHNRAENGVITLVLPKGVAAEALVASRGEGQAGEGGQGQRQGCVAPCPASAMDPPSATMAGFLCPDQRTC